MAAGRGRPGTSPGGRDPRPRGRSSARDRTAGAASGTERSTGQPAPEPSDQARDAVVAGKAAPRRVGARTSAGAERTFFGLSTARAVILAVVVCALALTLAVPLRTYFSQRAELDQVLADRQDLENKVAALELEKAQLNDPVRIAAEARTRLRWVMPGETPYTVQLPGDEGPSDEEVAAAKKSEGPWYRDLWESAVQPQETPDAGALTPPAVVPAPAPAPEGGPVG
ncbi:cell division protein FtsL [Rhodococcus sp. G-MC3]|uniref:septum formation initiator family protein n=1 Tax=Rhodococcus sp. G-MC3 TaxID=3046209 RepID=UPI0024B8FA12|nr:cell division protein FtsL [Rhodococcus sp. G-MC3]MDJ0394039.1 cell division protein FtsL [Rhodococcus sp. G-MC3]